MTGEEVQALNILMEHSATFIHVMLSFYNFLYNLLITLFKKGKSCFFQRQVFAILVYLSLSESAIKYANFVLCFKMMACLNCFQLIKSQQRWMMQLKAQKVERKLFVNSSVQLFFSFRKEGVTREREREEETRNCLYLLPVDKSLLFYTRYGFH